MLRLEYVYFFFTGFSSTTSYSHTHWRYHIGHVWKAEMWHRSWLHHTLSCNSCLFCPEWNLCLQHQESKVDKEILVCVLTSQRNRCLHSSQRLCQQNCSGTFMLFRGLGSLILKPRSHQNGDRIFFLLFNPPSTLKRSAKKENFKEALIVTWEPSQRPIRKR